MDSLPRCLTTEASAAPSPAPCSDASMVSDLSKTSVYRSRFLSDLYACSRFAACELDVCCFRMSMIKLTTKNTCRFISLGSASASEPMILMMRLLTSGEPKFAAMSSSTVFMMTGAYGRSAAPKWSSILPMTSSASLRRERLFPNETTESWRMSCSRTKGSTFAGLTSLTLWRMSSTAIRTSKSMPFASMKSSAHASSPENRRGNDRYGTLGGGSWNGAQRGAASSRVPEAALSVPREETVLFLARRAYGEGEDSHSAATRLTAAVLTPLSASLIDTLSTSSDARRRNTQSVRYFCGGSVYTSTSLLTSPSASIGISDTHEHMLSVGEGGIGDASRSMRAFAVSFPGLNSAVSTVPLPLPLSLPLPLLLSSVSSSETRGVGVLERMRLDEIGDVPSSAFDLPNSDALSVMVSAPECFRRRGESERTDWHVVHAL